MAVLVCIGMAEEIFEDFESYDQNVEPSNFGFGGCDANGDAEVQDVGFIFNKKKKIKKPPGEPKDIFDEALNYHEAYLEE